MIELYHCQSCNKNKEWCEMDSIVLCKNCWAKGYTKKYEVGAMKTWDARRKKK